MLVACFLGEWNGVSLLKIGDCPPLPDCIIQTNAPGTWGCGAYLQGRWLQWQLMATSLVNIIYNGKRISADRH